MVPAARDGSSNPSLGVPAEVGAAVTAVEVDSELVASLMTGMSPAEQHRLRQMISSSIEEERLAALDGTVRRQVDVGVRRRRSARELTDVDAGGASDGRGDVVVGDMVVGDMAGGVASAAEAAERTDR